MRAKSEIKPITTITITIIISSIILASSTYLFYLFLIPMYNINVQEFYIILVRLLPIIVGLLLTIISLVIAPVYIPHTSSKDDELPIDAYTAPLYVLPDEDKKPLRLEETEKVQPSPIQSFVVNQKVAPVETPFIKSLETVTPPMSVDVESLIQEPIVIVEDIPFATNAFSSNLDRAVDFSDYPFSITKESDIASLLEPIAMSTSVDLDQYNELTHTVEDTLEARLEDEILSATTHTYPLSVAIFNAKENETLDETILEALYQKLNFLAQVYVEDDDNIYAIYPFYSYRQCQMSIASTIKAMKKLYPLHPFAVGFTSLQSDDIEESSLLSQAHIALELALEQETDSIIGFESVAH